MKEQFEQSWSDECLKTLCAFANTEGVNFYLKEEKIDKIKKQIRKELRINPTISRVTKDRKKHIEIKVTSSSKTIKYKDNFYVCIKEEIFKLEENHKTELKTDWNSADCYKALSALANSEGGRLFVGIDDKKEVIGLHANSDESLKKKFLEKVPNQIYNTLDIIPKGMFLKVNEKNILIYEVKKCSFAVSYNGQYFKRNCATSPLLKGKALDEFLNERSIIPWDNYPVEKLSVSGLNRESINQFRELLKRENPQSELSELNNENLIQELDLMTEDRKLKRAAFLLFTSIGYPNFFDFLPFMQYSFIKINTNNNDNEEKIEGNLFEQLGEIIKSLSDEIQMKSILNLKASEQALKEVIYAAFILKDYSISCPIYLEFSNSKLYFKIPSQRLQVLNTIDQETDFVGIIEKNIHSFNPNLSSVFKKIGFDIEEWLKKNKSKLKVNSNQLYIEFKNNEIKDKLIGFLQQNKNLVNKIKYAGIILPILFSFTFIFWKKYQPFSPSNEEVELPVQIKKDPNFMQIVKLRKFIIQKLLSTCSEIEGNNTTFKKCLKTQIDKIQ